MKAASGSYEDITMADPLGAYSSTPIAILADSSYYLRVSADTSGTWGVGDNFAKMSIVSVEAAKVSVKTAYQKIRGLRWLVK